MIPKDPYTVGAIMGIFAAFAIICIALTDTYKDKDDEQ